MKKLLLLLSAVGMIFTACTPGSGLDDDNNGNPTEQPGGGDQGGEEIPADKTQAIKFQDENTKLLCTLHWDENEDGELSYEEAAAVTDLGTAVKGSSILAFTELKYFTSLEKIADNAFEGCVSLVKITLPEQLTIIGTSAFNGCTNLKKIAIPNAVTEIGDYAFRDCTSLTSITIPDSVTSIGNYAFENCSSLTSITIPDSVTSIGYAAFRECTSLTSVTIPNSVTSIGNYAFQNCRSLTSVTIPDSVTSIGNSAFYGCTGELIVNSKIVETDYNYDNPPSENGWLAGAKFTKLTIGNSVTSIGEAAFYLCSSLASVTIPDSVTSIGGLAFEGCTSLTSVTIPDSVTWIGAYTFSNCTSLTDTYVNITDLATYATSNNTNLLPGYKHLLVNGTEITELVIPDSVTSIGERAFSGCTSLTSVTIPDSVTSIGDGAFSGCSNLKEFKGEHVSSDGRCLIIDGVLFYCAPAGLTTEYTIPDSVTSIGTSAFDGCDSLTSITIPDSVTSIGTSAFWGCTKLTSVTIGNGVTSIGTYAFYKCTSLTSVTIPDSVTSIGSHAFEDCSSLTSVYCKPTTPPTGGYNMFSYYSNGYKPLGCKIYVPTASVEAYKAAWLWSEYASDIEGYDF